MNAQIINNAKQTFGSGERRDENQAAPIIYAPTGKSQSSSNLKGLAGIVTGGIFFLAGLLFSILLVLVFPPAAAVTALFSIISLGLAIGCGGWLLVRRSEKLQLTSDALFYQSRTRTAELQLYQIERIYAVQRMVWRESALPVKRTYQIFYWCVRIETITGSFIELEITQPNWLGTFDVNKLLLDLLPRLSTSVQIDPRIQTFLQTGSIN